MSELLSETIEVQSKHSPTEAAPSSPIIQSDGRPQRKKSYYILILGPSGSGKSSLINTVSDEKALVALPDTGLCTTVFRMSKVVINRLSFKLIDSPGFDTPSQDSKEIFKRLIRYMISLRGATLTGVLYLHPEGSDLSSSQLKQDIGALKFFLGDSWLPYVTIAAVAGGYGQPASKDTIRDLRGPASPFHDFHVRGAKIRSLTLKGSFVRNFLLDCDLQPTEAPDFQTKFKAGHTQGLEAYINEAFGQPNEVISSPREARPTGRGRRLSLKSALEESTESQQQLQLALAERENEIQSLRNELDKTRSEYASLRSELQLQDNMEQNKIVQSLKDLNRDIENLGRSVGQRLVDNHIDSYSGSEDTTLKALNLPILQTQFGHREGETSLISSSSGAGMPAEDFFDFALRSILCRRLFETIFLPFHPTLTGTPVDGFMAGLYEKVRQQDHHTAASKWRASAFLALSQPDESIMGAKLISNYIEQIVTTDLNALFKGYFGEHLDIGLVEDERKRLNHIISSAWDWNQVLRGSVIVLGDFQPRAYAYGVPFDSHRMEELEPGKDKKVVPKIAVCTIGLGLVVSRPKVKGGIFEEETVCQALVVTERRYN